ncbi:MAG: alkaline phosphatase family protein [Rhodospirillales bacterium]|nr:alkaline phosphatase family protein [Rhodospirillales bacterium]MBO6788760.1 alkaline phosphatase family protein [Rhodospirillales bacterium]
MKRVVIVICDGLRADMVGAEHTPNLMRIAEAGVHCQNHGGVFPSTTRTTAASIATGCLPGTHGLQGNAIALDHGEGLKVYSVGPPDFRDKLHAAKGRTLKVPTMSERVKDAGGAVIYANASPGAGIFLDPDGHGHMIHRDVAFGPGRVTLEPHGTGHDAAGDAALTQRFIDEILHDRKPALSLMWMCEPDHTQHGVALGSPAHIDVVRAADAQAGRVYDNIRSDIDSGEVLFMVASDHGHETVAEVIDLEDMLIDIGLKDGPGSPDVAIAPQGMSATIYLSDLAKDRRDAIADHLRADARIGSVVTGDEMRNLGLDPNDGLDIVVVGAASEAAGEGGLPGTGYAFQGDLKISNNVGCGQHGGLGKYEQSPFLILAGGGFAAGTAISDKTSPVDIAPTAMRHLGLGTDGMDGRALQS